MNVLAGSGSQGPCGAEKGLARVRGRAKLSPEGPRGLEVSGLLTSARFSRFSAWGLILTMPLKRPALGCVNWGALQRVEEKIDSVVCLCSSENVGLSSGLALGS